MKKLYHFKYIKTITLVFFLILFVTLVGVSFASKATYEAPKEMVATSTTTPVFVATHVETPNPVKGLYMTACVAATPSWRTSLEKLIQTTELNSVVIDIKDYSGTVSIEDPTLQTGTTTGCRVKDMRDFLAELHKNNIYAIGRITVFQDPHYTKLHPELAVKSKSTGGVWKDRKGLSFVDVGAKPYWDYILKIATTSYALGFDELNFDYIRYPSDGNMQDTNYTWTIGTSTKAEMLETFFSYLHDNLKNTGEKTSADLFGLVTIAQDDMGIGQELLRTLPYFDFIDPMVYPSHFAPGADGYKSPAEHPYEIVQYSMAEGLKRERALDVSLGISTSTPPKLRPWLQDFNLLGVPYGVPEVRAQIKATNDVGLTSWLMWDAANKYSPGAYLPQT